MLGTISSINYWYCSLHIVVVLTKTIWCVQEGAAFGGIKDSRVLWLGDKDKILCTGFNTVRIEKITLLVACPHNSLCSFFMVVCSLVRTCQIEWHAAVMFALWSYTKYEKIMHVCNQFWTNVMGNMILLFCCCWMHNLCKAKYEGHTLLKRVPIASSGILMCLHVLW